MPSSRPAVRPARGGLAARRRLVTGGEVRLSDLGEPDLVAFGLFPQLLGDALATWRPGITRTVATSNDGSMEIRLALLPGGGQAEVRTPDGVLCGPEHLMEIIDLSADRGGEEA
ncbi:DUF2397 family protein [Streptomyces apocyni]|uniref:DUF2397 family protein n=1 Tax=Streptomyces apocyni TaxID=2654677 RepID=UPI001E3004C2|nr:DUF2397 family protein [Streptomyces apocyni]